MFNLTEYRTVGGTSEEKPIIVNEIRPQTPKQTYNKGSYREYLASAHWRSFRAQIRRERRLCQWCGTSKGQFDIHHKHYRSLGHEERSDVLYLCHTCHIRLHKKTRWEKAKKNRQDMDFTKVSEKSVARFQEQQQMLDFAERCERCGEMHDVYMKSYNHGDFEIMFCESSKPRVKLLRKYQNS